MTELVRPTPAPFPWADPFFTLGVTGTNGKTSTTLLLGAALAATGRPILVETTLGYTLSGRPLEVPRTLEGYLRAFEQASREGCRDAAIEVTSQALAQGYAKRWRFDLGVFTNLSRDHLSQHGSWEHYLASKAQLFVHLAPGRSAVLNAADESALLVDQVTPPDVKRLWYAVPSRGPLLRDADLVARDVSISAAGTRVELEPSSLAEALGGNLHTQLIGQVFAENALAAAAGALAAGVDAAAVARGIADCPGVPGRFELVAREPVVVAVDYAHTPDALGRTADTARALAGKARVIVVFGAGGGADPEKREPMGRAVGERADVAIVTTDNPRREDPKLIAKALVRGAQRGGRAYVVTELDRRAAIRQALERAKPGDVVVIAGKGHEQGQVIGDETLPFSDVEEAGKALG
ncbi:MAG: UDP-N-acetylmuramyl-tripeptide synthetase [Polyangiaceae bacterium]|nr:UDP-N-acetylmuramyl-tripeptide synthetase [Polyangiaceae bacterium]MCE7891947.1 UDP-N-acetylmuramyl-tripeptide synthetase [Sorangiineae bacterium PRO1]MCL4752750.1 UDP-N-acetylmuramyl-tripeptide synthetase [Myxococcales bacterium]